MFGWPLKISSLKAENADEVQIISTDVAILP
jgi:hypothetical protein